MTTSEKDAKFRFCPLLTTPEGKMRFCQGSQCMMWRWLEEEEGAEAPGFCGLAAVPAVAARRSGPGGFLAAPRKEPDNPFG